MLKRNYKGYIYLLPALIILGIFVFYPIINTIIFSFDETKASGFKFGFGSYKYLFTDKRFLTSLFNTVIYAAIVPIISVFISLLLANTLVNLKNEKIHFEWANLISYSHGEYFPMPKDAIGSFGYSVAKKKTIEKKATSKKTGAPSVKNKKTQTGKKKVKNK